VEARLIPVNELIGLVTRDGLNPPAPHRCCHQLARDDALVFADHDGRHLQPEHFSRSFADALRRCAKQLGAARHPAARPAAIARDDLADGWGAGACGLAAARPHERRHHAAGLRARCAWQPARRGRPVRLDHRRGGVMRPEASERHHGHVLAKWAEPLICADVVSEGDCTQIPMLCWLVSWQLGSGHEPRQWTVDPMDYN
jgi:hypothetical protein